MLAVATLVGANILQHVPPFNWKVSESLKSSTRPRPARRPARNVRRPEAFRQKQA